jgi:hypothetical protein
MCLMMLLGVALAAAAFNVHPLLGVIVGFLFVGGAGWRFLAGVAGMTFGRLLPSGRKAYGPEGREFIAAWERRMGEMQFGRPQTQPPAGTFQAWLREYERSGISAGDWLNRQMGMG